MNEDMVWLTINEYSNFKKISVSTIRRYIKSGHVKSKKEDGKYLIEVSREKYMGINESINEANDLKLKLELDFLKQRISLLEEENNDLRMLVQIYESGSQKKENFNDFTLPAIPNE